MISKCINIAHFAVEALGSSFTCVRHERYITVF